MDPSSFGAHLCAAAGQVFQAWFAKLVPQTDQAAGSFSRQQACKPPASIDNQLEAKWPTRVRLDRILRVAELHQSKALALLAGPAG